MFNFKNTHQKLYIPFFGIVLLFAVFTFLFFSSHKVYADTYTAENGVFQLTPHQAQTIYENPTKYISFYWVNTDQINVHLIIPGTNGKWERVFLYSSNGVLQFLQKQQHNIYSETSQTLPSGPGCSSTGTSISISAYNYGKNGWSTTTQPSLTIYYKQITSDVGGSSGCSTISLKSHTYKVSSPQNANFFLVYSNNEIKFVTELHSVYHNNPNNTFKKVPSNKLYHVNLYFNADATPLSNCPDRIAVAFNGSTPSAAELYEFNSSSSGSQASSITAQNVPPQAEASSCHLISIPRNIFDPNSDLEPGGGSSYIANFSLKLHYASDKKGYNLTPYIENFNLIKYNSSSSSSTSSNPSGSTSSTPTCESSSWSLSWLACSVINEIAKIEGDVEKIISKLLTIQTFTYTTKTCHPGQAVQCIYTVWNNFRTYADVLLVIGFLVVIFAESIGGGLIDAYSIRKILPRILIAAILINLSIYIVGALVDITNIFGQGIYSLLTAPFGSSLSIHLSSATGITLGLGFASAVGIGVVATTVATTIFAKSGKSMLDVIIGLLFMIGLPVLMAVLGVLVTIIFRIAIIYFLTIISPIAFVLYILPNTEQYFKKWWKVLMEALLVYPIVFIVFAMSAITGAIVSSISLSGPSSVLVQILGIAARLAPLFLIPFAFKIAGNTIGTVHDAVTKGIQKVHGGIKGNAQDPNSLQNKIKRRFGMATNNMGISKGALFDQVGNAPRLLTRRGREERRRRLSERSTMRGSVLGSEFLDKDGIWQKNKNNDKFLLAHADKDLAIRKRKEAEEKGDFQTVAAWDQAISASDMVTRNNATMALSANQLASTGFGFSAGRKGYNELATMTARHAGVSFNDLEKDNEGNVIGVKEGAANAGIYQKMMNDNQFALRQAQRYDLGGVNDGKGYDYDAGMDKASGYTAGNAKPQTWEAGAQEKLGIEKISGDVVEDANQLATNWKSGKVKEADIGAYMGKLAESYQGATGGNKKIIMDQMNAIEAFTTEPGISNEFSKEMTNLKNSAISGRGIDPNILNSK